MIPPRGTVPPLSECVCDVKKLYSNTRRSLDALSCPQRGRDTGRWIYFSRPVVYSSLSVVAAVLYLQEEVCVCVSAFPCLAVAVNRSSASVRLMYSSADAESCSTYTARCVRDWITLPVWYRGARQHRVCVCRLNRRKHRDASRWRCRICRNSGCVWLLETVQQSFVRRERQARLFCSLAKG